jgi:Putative transposase of IS4/5 family (DUF4096)
MIPVLFMRISMVWRKGSGPNSPLDAADRSDYRQASDKTDKEWAVIAPHMPPERRRRRRTTPLRELVNAIFHIAQSCCQW